MSDSLVETAEWHNSAKTTRLLKPRLGYLKSFGEKQWWFVVFDTSWPGGRRIFSYSWPMIERREYLSCRKNGDNGQKVEWRWSRKSGELLPPYSSHKGRTKWCWSRSMVILAHCTDNPMLSLTSDAMQTCYADYRTDYFVGDIQLQPCTESSLISPQTRAWQPPSYYMPCPYSTCHSDL